MPGFTESYPMLVQLKIQLNKQGDPSADFWSSYFVQLSQLWYSAPQRSITSLSRLQSFFPPFRKTAALFRFHKFCVVFSKLKRIETHLFCSFYVKVTVPHYCPMPKNCCFIYLSKLTIVYCRKAHPTLIILSWIEA